MPRPEIDNQDDIPLQLPQNNILNDNHQPDAHDPLQHYADNILEKDLIAVRGKKRFRGNKKKKGKSLPPERRLE